VAQPGDNPRSPALREIVRDPSKLQEKRKELDNLRTDDFREWVQNKAFYRNQQWVFWNNASGTLQSLATDDGDKPRYKIRLTANQITGGVTQLVAQMTKTRPTIRAVPDSGSDRDVKAAELAESLYDFWWKEFNLDARLTTALTNAQLNQGWWLITWDALAGKPFRVMVDPTGKPITSTEMEDIYTEELEDQAKQNGMDPQQLVEQYQKTLMLGDISVRTLSGEQVWIDPTADSFDDAAYAICKLPMDIDAVEARYGHAVTPDAVTGEAKPALAYTGGKDARAKNVRDVYIGYFKPTPQLPKGRYVAWIEGPNTILEESDWPYPTSDLPLVKFPGIERPGHALDDARVTQIRPLQKELNLAISKVAMYRNLTLKPQMVAPYGSLRQRITDEPGAVFEYNAVAGLPEPQWRPVPTLPQYIFESIQDVQARIDRAFNKTPTERSQLPARTDSGQLLDQMQEAVADLLSPEIRRMETALARAGKLMAALAKKYYIEPRLLKITGDGGSIRVKKFLNSELEGGYTFHAEAGSGLPRTRAGQVAQIKELIGMNVLSAEDAMPYLPLGGLKAVQAKLMADEDYAWRKIDMLIKGEPLNMISAMDAVETVKSGENPTTGLPFQTPEEAQDFVQNAASSPAPFENWSKTMSVLRTHMLSQEFSKYELDVQKRFTDHYEALRSTVMSIPSQIEPIKTTMRLQGTVGPTVAADILRHGGIWSANQQSMAEPPLDTRVNDELSKPDASGSGNTQADQAQAVQGMMHASDQHNVAQAKAAHEVALSEHATNNAHMVSQRAEEVHQAAADNAHMVGQRAEEIHQAQLAQHAETLRQTQLDGEHRRALAAKAAEHKAKAKPSVS